MPIAKLFLFLFPQSFPPGGLRLFHFPIQLVLASLQRSGSRLIPATSADGYFRYVPKSVVNADFTEAKQKDRMRKKSVAIYF